MDFDKVAKEFCILLLKVLTSFMIAVLAMMFFAFIGMTS